MFDKMLYNLSIDGDLDGVIHALANGGGVTVKGPEGMEWTPLH